MTNSPFDPELRKFCLPAEFLIKTAFHQPLEKPPFGNEKNDEILLNDPFDSFIFPATAEDKEV